MPRLVIFLLIAILGCSSAPNETAVQQSPKTERREFLSGVIRRNLRFNLHCWCRAVSASTGRAVAAAVIEGDVAVLIDMLDDPNVDIGSGAEAALLQLGPKVLRQVKAGQTPVTEKGRERMHEVVLLLEARLKKE